ncbi:MAG: type II secretion system F family protein [Caulobacteraceae bacterium]|nr:type II secretion system F family protein [Caulobacteraceae bacterium]
MAEAESTFSYVAVDPSGRRIKGMIAARSDAGAFERLRRDGLSPISIRAQATRRSDATSKTALNERELAEFLSDLAALLKAGSDMRSALSILAARGGRGAIRSLCRTLSAEISGGASLDSTFTRALGKDQAFVGALVAAGEAGGDLSSGFQRGAEMLQSRIQLKDQLVSVLSYPAFVFASTIAAVAVILLFVIPSLAPLVQEAGAATPLSLKLMIGASGFLRSNLILLGALCVAAALSITLAGGLGLLTAPIERLLLDGPARRTTSGLVFGAFAIALGNMLAAGAPMSEALRLAIRSVRSGVARERLEPVAQGVRQGQRLSSAFDRVAGFPLTIVRLAAVGEESGALGAMLSRAGKIEEERAIRRIESIGRILGPALIVALGGVIGLLMAGLLSGVSQLGEAALQ